MSVRLRVTLVFVAVMALVLVAAGLFLYLRLGDELDDGIDRNLEARAGVFSERGDDTVAQVLDPSRPRLQSSEEAGDEPLLTPAQTREALDDEVTVEREIDDDRFRLLATEAGGGVVVVGESLDDRDEAVASLGALLLIGGPILLLLTAAVGYGATAAALRPVERMRARAAAIEATDRGARLPVPPADDEIGRLGATLNAMLDRIEAAFTRERTFVADASHELRTPLAILKTELELALSRGRTNEELDRRAALGAAEETDRLVALAEDLLVIARSDQGAAADPPRGGARRRAARAGPRPPRARRDAVAAADGLVLSADPLRLEQALGNLLDNARRYGGSADRAGGRGAGGAPSASTSATTARASPRTSTRSSASPAATPPAVGAAPGSGWRSSRRSRAPTGETPAPPPGGGADVWIELPGQSS